MKKLLLFIKKIAVYVLLFGFVLGFGINTYQTVVDKHIKFQNELYKVFLTPLNVAVSESILLTLLLLIILTILTRGIKNLNITRDGITFEAGENKKEFLEAVTKPLNHQIFYKNLRKTKNQVLGTIKENSSFLDLLSILFKEVEIYLEKETGFKTPLSVFEVKGTEDKIVKTLIESSLESKNAEMYEDNNIIRKHRYFVYAFEYDAKTYGLLLKSTKHKFDESDGELLYGIEGLAEDWFELSQSYIALSSKRKKSSK